MTESSCWLELADPLNARVSEGPPSSDVIWIVRYGGLSQALTFPLQNWAKGRGLPIEYVGSNIFVRVTASGAEALEFFEAALQDREVFDRLRSSLKPDIRYVIVAEEF